MSAATTSAQRGPWAGTRVVDLTGVTGAYGSRVWAALGADVIVAEPPAGSWLRTLEPMHPDVTGPEASLWWAYFAAGKRSVIIDPDAAAGEDTLERLVRSADVVFDDTPGPVDGPRHDLRRRAQEANPQLTWVSVTPFGLTGPRTNWPGSDLIGWAACGLASTVGFADGPPLAPAAPALVLSHATSLNAVLGGMLALTARRAGNAGQHVDISVQEVGLSLAPETGVPLFLDDQVPRPRTGNRRTVTSPFGLYEAADGWVSLIVLQAPHWRAMAQWIYDETGNEGVLDDVFLDIAVRAEAIDAVDAWTTEVTSAHSKLDLFIEGQRRGIPITPVSTVADLRVDPHLEAVGWWRNETHPTLGTYTVAGSPFTTGDDWWAWVRAPLLGEHTDEVIAEL